MVGTACGQPLEGCEPHHLLDERMYVAVPRGHPLAGRRSARPAEFAEEEWIAASSRPEETLMATALAQGFRPRMGFLAADWIAKQGFVAAGLGVTLVPELAASSARSDIALVPLRPGDSPRREVYAATPRGLAHSPATTAFLTLLRSVAAELTT